jgi:large subunit ribosomal protein L30
MGVNTMGSKLAIKLVRSAIGHPEKQKVTLKTLGLRRLGKIVVHDDTPQIRGMVRKVRHLVTVEEVSEEMATGGKK